MKHMWLFVEALLLLVISISMAVARRPDHVNSQYPTSLKRDVMFPIRSEIQPRDIHSKPLLHNFGVVDPGAKLTATFELVNDSSKVLQLLEIKSSCSCVVTQTDWKTIDSFEKRNVLVQYTAPSKISDDRREIVLLMDDGKARTLLLTAMVRRKCTVLPEEVILVASGNDLVGDFTIRNYSSVPWDTPRLATSSGELEYRISNTSGARSADAAQTQPLQTWTVTVQLVKTKFYPGYYQAAGHVVIPGHDHLTQEFTVKWHIDPELIAIPNSIVISGDGLRRGKTVRILTTDDLDGKLLQVSSDVAQHLQLVLNKVATRQWELKISGPLLHGEERLEGHIAVTCADCLLRIPFRAFGD